MPRLMASAPSPSSSGHVDLLERAGLPRGLADRLDALYGAARVVEIEPLGDDAHVGDASEKGCGYGRPVRIVLRAKGGAQHTAVFHAPRPNDLGQARRADRVQTTLLSWDARDAIPGHARVVDAGLVRAGGGLQSLTGTGEPYLLTAWCEGRPYAEDLRAIAAGGGAERRDEERARALARYLVALHRTEVTDAGSYRRSLRDLVGGGEGIAGIADGYPDDVPGVSRARLEAIERAALEWRFRLGARPPRMRRIHGDFHPFNIVFRGGADFSVLDASRGCAGDPADDVTALAANYPFFALQAPASGRKRLSTLWFLFWEAYQAESGDDALLAVVPPFLAWRLLVLASPVWYPHLAAHDRDALLCLAEDALDMQRFTPQAAREIFDRA